MSFVKIWNKIHRIVTAPYCIYTHPSHASDLIKYWRSNYVLIMISDNEKLSIIVMHGWNKWLTFCRSYFLLYARLKNGTYYAVAMSVRLSVRPSVGVFRTFLQHALRYQFETWYKHSVGGTTCRVWVASQLGHFDLVYSQKWVKPIFCNHGLINQDKFFKFGTQVACCILLDISSVFCENIIFRILAIIFVRFGFF